MGNPISLVRLLRGCVSSIAALAMFGGCSVIVVETNTYLSDDPFPQPSENTAIHVETHAPDQPVLLAREVAATIGQELERRGYSSVAEPAEADYVLVVTFGIDEGHLVTETVPQTSGYYATSRVYGFGGFGRTAHVYGRETTYTQQIRREFDRRLVMTLIDRPRHDAAPKSERTEAIVWQASAVSTGEERDLRSIIRYMLAAVFEYFGQDTGEAVRMKYIEGSDEAERFRLGGL